MMKNLNKNKQKLLKTINHYLQCAVFDQPEKLPLADVVKATYNGKQIEVGKNEIWEKAVRFQSRQTFADAVTNSAVFFGTATNEAVMTPVSRENPKNKPGKEGNLRPDDYNRGTVCWWFYVLRITMKEDKITEIEEITIPEHLVHFPCRAEDYPLYNPIFDMPVPESERSDREEIIQVADSYWEGLEKNIAWDEIPVHPDCQRVEMGILCTNSARNYHTVQSNFLSPKFTWKIANRRWYVVDEERGVAVCLVVFQQIKQDTPPGFIAAEIFKVQNGMLRDIAAFFKPMYLVSGWEESEVTGL